ncbi:VPEID-CTERM sorting domain-containing protein [Falsigemmobacter faecalis]|uniref:VPEID-CTERM sorting domain-containing protein n=1 Tax=Falsigemmobacter faecalis TaxID=2488730 RepID=A0A3P3DMY8_9RHOB|nr:VPEID-CTERM sorting domain-containing protein [Falsigemmobacter faecalis]RRH75535.1 VPEID-CTERM sorting domain-containing protein [Falsigemmobacter faecalis]
MAFVKSLTAAGVFLATAAPAMAQSWGGNSWSNFDWIFGGGHRPPPTTVPEIDVTSSALAVAAVLVALAFAWERSRRRA